MRNFMSYERRWLDEPHVGDHVGRSIWALGEVLSTAWAPARRRPRGQAARVARKPRCTARFASHRRVFDPWPCPSRSRPARSPRAARCWSGSSSSSTPRYATQASDDWRWFEDELRYDNARLPHALIVGGTALGREGRVDGLESLGWLGDECGLASGMLRLPGHLGRHRDEPAPGDGDEQPLDASALVEAELAAFSVTHDPEHGARAQTAFDWFLGRNRLDRPLYDFATGGCSDGLGEDD